MTCRPYLTGVCLVLCLHLPSLIAQTDALAVERNPLNPKPLNPLNPKFKRCGNTCTEFLRTYAARSRGGGAKTGPPSGANPTARREKRQAGSPDGAGQSHAYSRARRGHGQTGDGMADAWSPTSALAIDTVGKAVKWGCVPRVWQPSWNDKWWDGERQHS